MKTGHLILSAASILPLLTSCASDQKAADSQTWNIKPAFNIRHGTDSPNAYYRLGRYYQGQNRYEQALTSYKKALAIDGSFAEALNGQGVVYAMQGREQEAIEQFRSALKQAPNASHLHNNLGYALYLTGSYAEAVSALKKAVELDPSNQTARTNLALVLDKVGSRKEVVQVMAQTNDPQVAGNEPLVTQQAQQLRTEAPVPAQSVAAAAIPAPVAPQVLALPKDWGVITPAEQKPAPSVESRAQPAQIAPNAIAPNADEPRAQAHTQALLVTSPSPQASVQPKEQDMVIAQTAQKRVPAAGIHAHTTVTAQSAIEPQAAGMAAQPYRIEVSNGNGVTGFARKVAGSLESEGYSGARLTNHKPFNVTSSQVQYRAGFREQAQLLVRSLPGQPSIAQADNLRRDVSVRLVLGKDMASNVAHFEQRQDKINIVRKESDS